MSIRKAFTLFALVVVLPSIVSAQCRDLHKGRYCSLGGAYWDIDGQSTTAMVAPGDTNVLQIIAYKGQDYRINLCVMEDEIFDKIQWRVYEEVREAYDSSWVDVEYVDKFIPCGDCDGSGVDAYGSVCYLCNGEGGETSDEQVKIETPKTKRMHRTVQKEVFGYELCSWTDEEGMVHQDVEWTNMATRNVLIEIYVPAEATAQANLKGADMICLGVHIDHMKTPKSGF